MEHHAAYTFSLMTIITPIIGYLGIGFAYATIKINRKSNREKNALDFEKIMSDDKMIESMKTLYSVRSRHLNPDQSLNRKSMSSYMESVAQIHSSPQDFNKHNLSENEYKRITEKPNKKKTHHDKERLSQHNLLNEKVKVSNSLKHVLNAMEACSNAIRYSIYDEELIYNIYGSQMIEIYEMAYSYIRCRQLRQKRLMINAEWLAVKWTLEKTILETRSGDASSRAEKTFDVIKHAHEKLKRHKNAPDKSSLKPMLRKLKSLKYPS